MLLATASMRGSRLHALGVWTVWPLICEDRFLSLKSCCRYPSLLSPRKLLSFIMDDQQSSLIQALLNRMDHLEYRLLRQAQVDVDKTRDDMKDLTSVVGRIQKVRRAQADEAETSRAPVAASHRGPGGEPGLPTPSVPAREHGADTTEAPAQRQSPFAKFNKMVKSRPSSPSDSDLARAEQFSIATPPIHEANRLAALAEIARRDEELIASLPPEVQLTNSPVTADMATDAPLWLDEPPGNRLPVATTCSDGA